jgi:peroxiredoxin Q/BCP
LADEDLKIHEQYGVWQLKKFMGKEFMGTIRTTFLIDENGKLKNIIQKPASKKHAEEVLAAWENA